MIKYTQGDITKARLEAIVNTVNTVGVMGKGIALSFKKAFPSNYLAYKEACLDSEVRIGKMFVYSTGLPFPRLIINFPTKKHWRNPSQYTYIEEGLEDLVSVIKSHKIKSIAIPPLGCGNGGLDWSVIDKMINSSLKELIDEVDIVIYKPGLTSSYIKQTPSEKLTPARAMLLQLMRHYELLGEKVTPIIAQKLAYFLQRTGEPLRLTFDKGYYGPFAHQLSKVLEVMTPQFVKYEGNITSPYINIELQSNTFLLLENYSKTELSDNQKKRVELVKRSITGFENALGLELLATVDYAIQNCPDCSLPDLISSIHEWTNRKKELMTSHLISAAYDRVMDINSGAARRQIETSS